MSGNARDALQLELTPVSGRQEVLAVLADQTVSGRAVGREQPALWQCRPVIFPDGLRPEPLHLRGFRRTRGRAGCPDVGLLPEVCDVTREAFQVAGKAPARVEGVGDILIVVVVVVVVTVVGIVIQEGFVVTFKVV